MATFGPCAWACKHCCGPTLFSTTGKNGVDRVEISRKQWIKRRKTHAPMTKMATKGELVVFA